MNWTLSAPYGKYLNPLITVMRYDPMRLRATVWAENELVIHCQAQNTWPHVYYTSIIVERTVWNPQALVCCYSSLHFSVRAFNMIFGPGRRDLISFSHKSINESRHWCWVMKPSEPAHRSIPKVVELSHGSVQDSFREINFSMALVFVDQGIDMLKQLCFFPKCFGAKGHKLFETMRTLFTHTRCTL